MGVVSKIFTHDIVMEPLFKKSCIHHCREVMIRFKLAYSPDFMPLEEVFCQVKYFLKRSEVLYTSTDNPALLLTMAFASGIRDDCLGYIRHAGYCL